VQSALLLMMIATTATTLALGLTIRHVSENPFARTRAVTRGPDVVAEYQANPGQPTSLASAVREFRPLLHAPGVVSTAGPFPLALTQLHAPGIDVPVQAEGRDLAPTAIDRPLVTAGHWVQPGGIVVERGFAQALGLRVGQTVRLGSTRFKIVGIALTTAQAAYPAAEPGLIWLTRAAAATLATSKQPLGFALDLKLAPDQTNAFNNSPANNNWGNTEPNSIMIGWQAIREIDYKVTSIDQSVLLIVSWLMAMVAIASIAIAVGSRLAEQTRRVGLLKAVGATPRLVTLLLLVENLVLAIAATAVALFAASLAVPLLTNDEAGLLGTPGAPGLTVATVLEVLAAAIVVAAGATIVPAWRAARTSTVRALNEPSRPPSRRPRVIALSARLPVPLLLALRIAARRPLRALLACASTTIAVAMLVAAITLHYALNVHVQQTDSNTFLIQGGHTQVVQVVNLLSAILVVLAAAAAMLVTWATVADAQRPTALARALGATPRQITAGLAGTQLLPALVAGCLGIPLGLALYDLAGGNAGEAGPPLLALLPVIPATLLAITALTALPARIGAARSVADVLRAE
jgi:putative ABC transport system permease protein